MDSNDTDNGTRTPERSSHQRRYKKRRSRASSSERGGNKHRKTSKGISAEVLQLLAAWKEGPIRGPPYTKCPKVIVKCRRCNRVGHDYETCRQPPIAETATSSKENSESKKKGF
ncbi:hypothetical protein ACJJTC_003340 [Scirpophaga incertulas]